MGESTVTNSNGPRPSRDIEGRSRDTSRKCQSAGARIFLGIRQIERLAVLAAIDFGIGAELLFTSSPKEIPALQMAGAEFALLRLFRCTPAFAGMRRLTFVPSLRSPPAPPPGTGLIGRRVFRVCHIENEKYIRRRAGQGTEATSRPPSRIPHPASPQNRQMARLDMTAGNLASEKFPQPPEETMVGNGGSIKSVAALEELSEESSNPA